jgi:hypothetical protein
MLAAEQDPEFLAVNPADYIPAIQDVVMVEAIDASIILPTGLSVGSATIEQWIVEAECL